jgi:zinc transport system substrate-binding protein
MKLSDADLFLLHGWQGEQFSQELIDSADNPDLVSLQINASVGQNQNWMTPAVQIVAAESIADALAQVDPDGTDDYQAALEEYTAAVNARETALLAILEDKGLGAVNVMCADQQLGFVRWTGLNVVEVFGRPETFTPQILQDLVDKGRAGDVTLILDNMQSGADAGAGLAEELGAARVILSNFPGGYDDTDTWEETINLNVDMILEALGK